MKLNFDDRPYFGLTDDRHETPVTYPGERHIILIGPNGSGKDTRIIAPNLATLRRSVFVLDVKGEQAALTYRARAKFSKIIAINPCGLLVNTHPHLKSCGYDPIKHPDFNPANPNFNRMASNYGDCLIPLDGRGDSFWPNSARSVTAAGCMWERMQNGCNASLANVRRMFGRYYGLEGDEPVGLLKALIEMSLSGFDPIVSKVNRLLHPNNESRGVISSVLACTAVFDEPQLVEDMRKAKPFDFADMKKELITIYFMVPIDFLQGTNANYARLVIGTALRDLMKSGPGVGPRPLVVLNECAQLGHLAELESAMGIARGFGFSILTVWQSIGQMVTNFGKNAQTLIGARGALSAFAVQDWDSAEYLSKLTGHVTELVSSFDATPGRGQAGRQETPHGMPMLRPEDLMRLPPGMMLNFIEPVPYPFLTRAPGHWKLPWCQDLDPNPYYVPDNEQTGRPPKPGAPRQTNYRDALAELKRKRRKAS